MGIKPGVHNFEVVRRSDHSLSLEFKDGNDAAISLMGSTVTAQCWDKARTQKFADFAVFYVDRSAGKVDISLTDAQTTALPDSVHYDVLVANSAGHRDYYLTGTVTVLQGYTS